MRWVKRVAGVWALAVLTAGLPSCDRGGGRTEVTEIERRIAPALLEDGDGQATGFPYAEHITFSDPSVRVNPEDTDELLIELKVHNAGPKTVTRLHVWADFYNRDGRKAADEGELLAHDIGLGDNSSYIAPGSSKRAIIELDSPEEWTGGKMVITIDDIETE